MLGFFDWVEILIIRDLNTVYLQYISSIFKFKVEKQNFYEYVSLQDFNICQILPVNIKKKNLRDKASMNLNNKKKNEF